MPHQLFLPGLPRPDGPVVSDKSDDLMAYPNVCAETLCHNAKSIGAAGEYFAFSILMRLGMSVAQLPESDQADCLVRATPDYLRCQIKTATNARNGVYAFTMARGYNNAPQGRRDYRPGDFDMAALVILPEHAVKFTAQWRPSHRILACEIPGLRADPSASLRQALAALGTAPFPQQ